LQKRIQKLEQKKKADELNRSSFNYFLELINEGVFRQISGLVPFKFAIIFFQNKKKSS
jgi:hypothetical protein